MSLFIFAVLFAKTVGAKMVGQTVVQYVMYLTNEFINRCRRFCEDGWENRSMNDVITYKKCHVFDE